MKVLTVQQPWAWAIIHGGKDVENRGRNAHFRGRFYVHAGLELWEDDVELIRSWQRAIPNLTGLAGVRIPNPDEYAHGVIIGTVELTDVVRDSRSPWAFDGSWHYLLRDPRPLVRPIVARGRQGWWNHPSITRITETRKT